MDGGGWPSQRETSPETAVGEAGRQLSDTGTQDQCREQQGTILEICRGGIPAAPMVKESWSNLSQVMEEGASERGGRGCVQATKQTVISVPKVARGPD